VLRLKQLYQPERVYLFGSSTPASLCDSGRAYKAIWRLGAATDVLVRTHSDFEDRLPLKASLPSTIRREGKLLYGLGAVPPTRYPGSKRRVRTCSARRSIWRPIRRHLRMRYTIASKLPKGPERSSQSGRVRYSESSVNVTEPEPSRNLVSLYRRAFAEYGPRALWNMRAH
jgi:hypothetical protein